MHRFFPPLGFENPQKGLGLTLMLSGKKRFAIFFERLPIEFEVQVSNGTIGLLLVDDTETLLVYNTSLEDAREFSDLIKRARMTGFHEETERQIAQGLGHDEASINHFIECRRIEFTHQTTDDNHTGNPHEGREIELMLKGEKQVAMLQLRSDELDDYIAKGVFKEIIHKTYTFIIYLPEYQPEAEELLTIIKQMANAPFNPKLERRMGEILGYPKSSIDQYLISMAEYLKNLKNA